MRVVHCRYGPRFSQHEREVYGSTNRTGHGGCWINEDMGPCGPDCILADLDDEPTVVDLPEVKFKCEGTGS